MADQNAFPAADGLLVNPISIPTRFGTALPMMIHNHRFATRIGLQASHICLASPYLYALKPNLDEAVEHFDCGLPASTYPMHAAWHWHDAAATHARLAELARHLGVPLRVGRADGVYLPRKLFDEMLTLMHRFITADEVMALDPIFPIEEVLFPTMLPVLLGSDALIGATNARIWEPDDPPTPAKLRAAIASGLYNSGKRIPQDPQDPLRREVLANLPGSSVLEIALGTTVA